MTDDNKRITTNTIQPKAVPNPDADGLEPDAPIIPKRRVRTVSTNSTGDGMWRRTFKVKDTFGELPTEFPGVTQIETRKVKGPLDMGDYADRVKAFRKAQPTKRVFKQDRSKATSAAKKVLARAQKKTAKKTAAK